ncbi:Anthranilate synthase, aminase component [Chondromyces apiculatus DSM 436]|uniref:Anthranilate synthase, aminase component n=1 Tax=Chondromyces apiculatus DSM 436 TaxID=1192034 RepID=A0A017SZP9_9BACT|nr:Anthranilate synthase, aminase component [Chondromyces apiculatus DSM 436]
MTAPLGEGLGRWSFVAAEPDRRSARLDPLGDDPEWQRETLEAAPAEKAVPVGLAGFPRWIGVLPYEARRGLERPGWRGVDTRPAALVEEVVWRRYPAVIGVDHREGQVWGVGVSREALEGLLEPLRHALREGRGVLPGRRGVRVAVEDDDAPERHVARVRAALELIRQGDLYQVNLARRLRLALREGDALGLYEQLAQGAPSPLGALLEIEAGVWVASTSPELFLLAEPGRGRAERGGVGVAEEGARAAMAAMGDEGFGRMYTAPIKGTRPRGKGAEEDAGLVVELDGDPKERAELTMIVDVERNDLGRVAAFGSVRMLGAPRVVTHRTVHHRVAWLSAQARAGLGREAVLEAMLPSGSVTGAPKVRAMEVIAGLEPRRRGLYTGAFGCVAHGGRFTLAMGIRTAVLAGGEGEYFTGGGIVADSDPERELEETRWKALQLQRAAGG